MKTTIISPKIISAVQNYFNMCSSTHVEMDSHVPKTDFELHMLKEFCTAAAKGIKVHCAREYWGDPDPISYGKDQ